MSIIVERHRAISRVTTVLASVLSSFFFTLAASASVFTGTVVSVVDGDTVIVRDESGYRRDIRIAGIDAPEIRQSYGPRARQHMIELAYGKRVTVSWYKHDRYDRLIGVVRVMLPANCRGSACTHFFDAGLAQIESGLAWHDKEHLTEQAVDDQQRYAHAEREARLRRIGLWSQPRPVPPWQYRHRYDRALPTLPHLR